MTEFDRLRGHSTRRPAHQSRRVCNDDKYHGDGATLSRESAERSAWHSKEDEKESGEERKDGQKDLEMEKKFALCLKGKGFSGLARSVRLL